MKLLMLYKTELEEEKCNGTINKEHDMLLSVFPMLIKESQKYTNLVKTKDEIDDIDQSLVEFCLKCINSYNDNKGAKFSTYLCIRLKDFNSDFISKYYGIKTSRNSIRQYKEKTGEDLKIYFQPLDTFEF